MHYRQRSAACVEEARNALHGASYFNSKVIYSMPVGQCRVDRLKGWVRIEGMGEKGEKGLGSLPLPSLDQL
jgi:hypothetical protein